MSNLIFDSALAAALAAFPKLRPLSIAVKQTLKTLEHIPEQEKKMLFGKIYIALVKGQSELSEETRQHPEVIKMYNSIDEALKSTLPESWGF